MSTSILVSLGVIVIFVILIYSLVISCDSKKESWVNYQQFPFNNIQTGAGDSYSSDSDIDSDTYNNNYKDNSYSNPISFYSYPIYRKPLNWPICHLVDYPVPHCRADSL